MLSPVCAACCRCACSGSHGGVPTPPPLPSPFAGKRADASLDTHRSEASSTNGASPNKGLHSVRSLPVQGMPHCYV